jgi:hypothetical protein
MTALKLPAWRIGGKMIRISVSYFYGLGAAIRPVAGLQPGMTLQDVWGTLFTAEMELRNLFATDWFLPAVKNAWGPGQKLIKLVSSMLAAIQDFVRDSFRAAEQQGLDALRLGELRLWSEAGPFATLVAMIRGNPPEGLHETLSRIHAKRFPALESFDGDSSSFADVEANLTECVALRQQAQQTTQTGFPWLVALAGLVLLLLAGVWGFRWWQGERLWEDYVMRLRTQPGIVITELGRDDGKFQVAGLRDPPSVDPMLLLREARIDPARVTARWQTYQSLHPEFVMKRLQASLDPPTSVTLAVEGDHIVAQGSAPSPWIERARTARADASGGRARFRSLQGA